jgi:predicted glycoside hydrolase/deacetylase ChbG (UPF0249 family)
MLIINADDLGRDDEATDSAMECFHSGRITSASFMVFMADSRRAAELAKKAGIETGLHLNFTEKFTAPDCPPQVLKYQERIRRFLKPRKRTHILYYPFLRRDFRLVIEAQFQEFRRLLGQAPSHFDGHQHMHLSTNILAEKLIPPGQKVRRNFSCLSGDNPGGLFKRTYLKAVDAFLSRNYLLTDYFFSLSDRRKLEIEHKRIERVLRLAGNSNVELMVHPQKQAERRFLLGQEFNRLLEGVTIGTHSMV